MASAKEIRSKIGSIKNTRKITRAMEMVAASKMRKAQERMYRSRPYARRICQVIGHLAKSHPEFQHIYLQRRVIKRVGYIIISTDRGLCGGLNTNLFKKAIKDMERWHDQGIEIDLCIVGQKAENFFKRYGGNVLAHAKHLGDAPSLRDLIGVVKVMFDAYGEGKLDVVNLVHNDFINTMKQVPEVRQLLPLLPSEEDGFDHHWDYIYEPDAKSVLTELLKRFIDSQVYQGVVENIACEQAARMVAMKNASENANGLIDDLQLAYNKARQSAITRELSEIVSGADAV